MKHTLKDICEKLEKVIDDKQSRVNGIKEIQSLVWEKNISFNKEVDECLADLALDLDYYEEDEIIRNEDVSFYGEERLVEEINNALKVLRPHLKNVMEGGSL